MKIYRIAGGTFVAGVGAQLLLLAGQADSRRHNLEPFTEADGVAIVITKAAMEFKSGEVLGLAEVPKSMSGLVEEVKGRLDRKSPEAVLAGALKAIDEEAARRARVAERQATEEANRAAAREKEEADWAAEFASRPDIQSIYPDAAAYVTARRQAAAG